jgi:hypothetical protein
MKKYLQQISVFIFLFISSYSYSQKGYYDLEESMPFQPMFSLGSGFYNFQGDIEGPKSNLIGGSNIGFNAGMRLNMSKDFDVSLIFSRFSLSEDNGEQSLSSGLSTVGLHCDYIISSLMKKSRLSPFLSFGLESISFKTKEYNAESSFSIPIGLGVMLDVSERIKINVGMNYAMLLADIDKTDENNNDKMIITDFTIHYDLFTPKPKVLVNVDETYYDDVNFNVFDVEDEDGDLIADSDDFCPKTPQGVDVDVNGCPLDADYDGIPNYIDEQEYTTRGAVVNERGVQLTDEEYRSMYSDYKSATREYATYYNEYNILQDDYKTINDYLIAKANAFNKAFNEGQAFSQELEGPKYKVSIASYDSSVPADEMNNLLSIDDLQSFTMEDDVVIYVVGSYPTLDQAINRSYAMEGKGFDNTYIMVDNAGEISRYIESVSELIIDEEEVVVAAASEKLNNDLVRDSIIKQVTKSSTIYRIQVGAYSKNKPLSEEVFIGVNNVISFTGKDGLIRYMAGSFNEYKDAVDYKAQMRARGFDDAFIVTYKNGERISLNIAIKTGDTNLFVEDKESDEVPLELRFIVQIMVDEFSVSAVDLQKMSKLGNIDKEQSGSLYKYYAGTYSNLEEANKQLDKAKLAGFSNAFVFATRNSTRITLEEAEELLK